MSKSKEGICLITGSSGLIGSEAVSFMSDHFEMIVGIDNNMRKDFFGKGASVEWNTIHLKEEVDNFKHHDIDIRDREALKWLFSEYSNSIGLIIHAAAQPSHDWAAKNPFMDFSVNATGTLNILELSRKYCPRATFIFTSTNKVYGDSPNYLPLKELDTRYEIDEKHSYYKKGIGENMSIDQCKHTLFGASKVAADVLVQEYGRYFGMNTGVFRGGCLTGPKHSGTQLHGFLSYLMKCAVTKSRYTVLGYKGKQVRDNIHSWDLVNMFWHFHQNPQTGVVYNAGGGRHSNCSMKEAISKCEEITGNKMNLAYSKENRIGDHIWWISDVSKFKTDFPTWDWKYNIDDILVQIFDNTSSK